MKSSKPFPPDLSSILFRYLAIAARHQTPYAQVLDELSHDTQTFGKHTQSLKLLSAQAGVQTRLPDMLATQAGMFAPSTLALLASAQDANQLPVVLDTLARDCSLRHQGRADVRAAMVWPVLLTVVLCVVMTCALVFVMPAFKQVFSSFGAQLPLPSRVLVSVSDFLLPSGGFPSWWEFSILWVFAVLIAATAIAVRCGLFPPALSACFWRVASRIPRVRHYFACQFGARLATWTAAVGHHSAPFSAALQHLQETSTAPAVRKASMELAARLQSGLSMAAAFEQIGALPQSLVHAARAAQTPQGNAAAMALCQELTQERALRAGEQLARWIFFFSYLLIGLLTAFLLIAIYLPIFAMGSLS